MGKYLNIQICIKFLRNANLTSFPYGQTYFYFLTFSKYVRTTENQTFILKANNSFTKTAPKFKY